MHTHMQTTRNQKALYRRWTWRLLAPAGLKRLIANFLKMHIHYVFMIHGEKEKDWSFTFGRMIKHILFSIFSFISQ